MLCLEAGPILPCQEHNGIIGICILLELDACSEALSYKTAAASMGYVQAMLPRSWQSEGDF